MTVWYAHYKFFYQMQHDWIDEQLKFSLWKDKLPRSFAFLVVVVALAVWKF